MRNVRIWISLRKLFYSKFGLEDMGLNHHKSCIWIYKILFLCLSVVYVGFTKGKLISLIRIKGEIFEGE